MPITKQTKLWRDKKEWRVICGTKEVEITLVKILDAFGKESAGFKVGDKIIVKADFVVHEEVKEPHFGVAIFRDDGVYCYGPNTLFDGYKIERLCRGEGWFSIEYERTFLMPGEYRLSVGIWDKKEVLPYSFHIAYYGFKILGNNKDNQLLFLPHKWNDGELINLPIEKDLAFAGVSFLEKSWQQKFNLKDSDIDISSIQLLGAESDIKDSFNTDELMEIKIKINGREMRNCLIWIGIFRIDGIYCQGSSIELAEDEDTVSLIYTKLHLLPGKYKVSVGVWDTPNQRFLAYSHGLHAFTIISDRMDHGTVYLEHRWNWDIPNFVSQNFKRLA